VSFCLFSFGHCCLFFFDTRILIAPLVSSYSSYYIYIIIAIASCTEWKYMSYFISALRFWGRVYESKSKMAAMAFEWSIRFRIRLLENYTKRTTHVHLKSSMKKKRFHPTIITWIHFKFVSYCIVHVADISSCSFMNWSIIRVNTQTVVELPLFLSGSLSLKKIQCVKAQSFSLTWPLD
jgi:hypothetical protein